MSNLDISIYSSSELHSSLDVEKYLTFINSRFDTMNSQFHCFDTPRFADVYEFLGDFKNPESVLAIARDPKTREIVAAGGYRPEEDTVAELKCLCAEAGKGYGTFMNKYVEDLARKKGFTKMNSVVIREHGDLVEFYQKLGYKKLRERRLISGGDDWGFGNIIDITIWFMQKDL
ncbi:hypothetical protein CJU89_4860 [Yarrowia sp. B02]|nr:hypothetical protein CJU89_4860 [Yarrowia sp. B02]